MPTRFVQRTHRFILQHDMVQPGETVLVGVSGGIDSLVLLYCLHALQHQLNCSLHVAHLDHGFRPDSAADAEFVRGQADRLNLPISTAKIDVPHLMRKQKLSAEAAARNARYQFYEDVSERIDAAKIALGHHKDDQAETFLMHLLRGAGSTGLKGMLPVRDGRFIRPLLTFSRGEIEEFAAELGLEPRQDSTNLEVNYLRNRIRLELMPLLEESYNSNLQNTLNQTAELLRAESDYLEAVAREAFEACRVKPDSPDAVVLDCSLFLQNHLALRRHILRLAVAEISGEMRDFYYNHFEVILKLIEGESPNASLNLPHNLHICRAYNRLIFQKSATTSGRFEYEIAVPGYTDLPLLDARMVAAVETAQRAELPDGKFQAVFDFNRVQFPPKLRNRQEGDRFQPFGMQGSKKIKDLLIDAKIPRHERDWVPILVSGDEILWVVGHRTSERFKIGSRTKRYLYLTYSLEK